MNNQSIDEIVIQVLSDLSAKKSSAIRREDNIHDDLGLDSLESALIFVKLDEIFGVPQPSTNDQMLVLITVEEIIEYAKANYA